MLKELGYTVSINKEKEITATKKGSNVKASIGSNIVTVNGKNIYLSEIVWDVNDVILALTKPVDK